MCSMSYEFQKCNVLKTNYFNILKQKNMQNWLKTLIAGGVAWKWGGGCFGTIALFVIIYWLLGQSGC